jgi:hypothetical protein
MNSQNKKINVYDFNFKIDDDFYFVNGVSYKRIDICIPESENFTNSDDLRNYINNIDTIIGSTDTIVNVNELDINNLNLLTLISSYSTLLKTPIGRCDKNVNLYDCNKLKEDKTKAQQEKLDKIIVRINFLITNIQNIQKTINDIIININITNNISSFKNTINDNNNKIKNSNNNITGFNKIYNESINQSDRDIARNNMYKEYITNYNYNMNVITAQQKINKIYLNASQTNN